MALVAIDTCFGACSVAVALNGRVAACAYEERRTGHAEAVVPMIEHVLGQASLLTAAIRAIAVTRGPGTFAGMRIGLAAAEGLRLATGAALIPVSSLWAIGQRVLSQRGPMDRPLAIAVDAGRGQVYVELLAPDGIATGGPDLLTIEQATDLARAAGAGVAGSGAHLIDMVDPLAIEPDAASFALAAGRLPEASAHVTPLYFRPADAVVQASPPGLR